MVLSLQGCMAAGKTSAAAYLQRHMPGVAVYYETNAPLIRQIREQGLDPERYEDFLEIQRRWIAYQTERYRQAARRPRAIIDFGPEEAEFHTLFYPQTIGQRWQIEAPLAPELALLRRCMPDRILFLEASEQTLRQRKQQDPSRRRGSFERYLTQLMPLKRQWFAQKTNVDYLPTDGLSLEQVGEKALAWAERCFAKAAP